MIYDFNVNRSFVRWRWCQPKLRPSLRGSHAGRWPRTVLCLRTGIRNDDRTDYRCRSRVSIERKITVGSSLWHRLPAFLYPTSHFVELPCQLVWQEAKIRKLDNSPHKAHTPDFHSCSSPQAANTSENRDFGQSKGSSLRILFTHETSSWGSKRCGMAREVIYRLESQTKQRCNSSGLVTYLRMLN